MDRELLVAHIIPVVVVIVPDLAYDHGSLRLYAVWKRRIASVPDMDGVCHGAALRCLDLNIAADLEVLDRLAVDGESRDVGVAASVLDAHSPETQGPRALFQDLLAVMEPAYIYAADLETEGIAGLDAHPLCEAGVAVDDEIGLVVAHIISPLCYILNYRRLCADPVP